MSKVLVIRTSSFGDVAMLAPVVYSVASRYPQTRFEVMTRQAFAPIFSQLGFNVSVLPIDLSRKHRGFFGLLKTVMKVTGRGYSHVADTHDVLRSKVIRTALSLTFAKVRKIDKGRSEKEEMLLTKNTKIPLKHTTMRYMEVFEKLGFPADIIFENLYDFNIRDFSSLKDIICEKKGNWVGIAPFAQHKGKIYPAEKMEEVIKYFSQRENTTVFIFGGGRNELRMIEGWKNKYNNVINASEKLKLRRELLLISYLDVMISMDSANMHLASLVKVPVVSIWGSTHPALGFYGFEQDIDNAIQIDMPCRPCSVYGERICQFTGKDAYKCLKNIECPQITSKVESILEKIVQ